MSPELTQLVWPGPPLQTCHAGPSHCLAHRDASSLPQTAGLSWMALLGLCHRSPLWQQRGSGDGQSTSERLLTSARGASARTRYRKAEPL